MSDAVPASRAPEVTAGVDAVPPARTTTGPTPGPTPEVREAEASFAARYRSDHDRLVRLAGLILGSGLAAEDVVQDAFAKLHGRFDRVANPGGWLRVAVVNGCRNEHRRLGRARRHLPRLDRRLDHQATERPEPTPELIDSLRRLPLRQRTVVVLRFYEDLTEADIARTMGISVGTVKSTLHRALAKLREEIEP